MLCPVEVAERVFCRGGVRSDSLANGATEVVEAPLSVISDGSTGSTGFGILNNLVRRPPTPSWR